MALSGNKGEWSEIYAFFKLLADGQLFSADENLEKTNSFVEIKSIFRNDLGDSLCYNLSDNANIYVVLAESKETILTFPQSKALEIAKRLVKEIKSKEKITETLIEILEDLKINSVKQKSQNKGDIEILIYDPIHGISSNQKFSIKSFLGSDPTLFNANKTTNIIYKVEDKNGNPVLSEHLEQINSIETKRKYIDRVKKLLAFGYKITFDCYEDETFRLNLQVIDSDLPLIIAHIVLDKYVSSVTRIPDVIKKLKDVNPMNYNLSLGHEFYEYRIVNFLVESALGMTSKAVWSGKYDVIGGIIIVKPNADLLCYHLIDFNKFKQYLKMSSRLDNPSGSKMGYGSVYYENEKTFIKLNFQVKA